MSELSGVLGAAVEVQNFCDSQGWRFCFIGGIAVQRWGMPRFTQDVDLTLLTGFGEEEPFVDAILARFQGRLRDAKNFAMERRVLLARTTGGIEIDFSLGAFPFEETAIERATIWRASDEVSLMTCTAEDLVIHKVFASRDRDWSDVESILIRQFGRLNLGLIRSELGPLLELKDEDPKPALDKFENLAALAEKRLKP